MTLLKVDECPLSAHQQVSNSHSHFKETPLLCPESKVSLVIFGGWRKSSFWFLWKRRKAEVALAPEKVVENNINWIGTGSD